ncbi:hypothetical protein ACFFMN_41875 [Planobispora siamensis]|uniref:Uncharacterized protein n=1 Tax=Planobispora siamensis TaxID=936338 RepID=A0A8J3WM22_9ACTN|nr:hypothetical protein [Planobispora siamensis]GIH95944.1 hypothetical protein Psi01_65740 [Planobispora siamensis]
MSLIRVPSPYAPGEPDWTLVARSLAQVIVMTVLLFMAGGVALSMIADARGPDRADERFAVIMGTAAKIANPDHRFHALAHDDDGWSEHLTLVGEPLTADDGISEDVPGRRVTYEITKDSSGAIDTVGAAPIGDSALDHSLMTIGERDQSQDAARSQTRKRLDALPAGMNAVALVEFEHPLATTQVADFTGRDDYCGMVTYVYQPFGGANENAISWNARMAPFEGHTKEHTPEPGCTKEPEEALAAFRSWTAELRPGDDAGLRGLSLTRARLAGAADKGLAYAFVAESWRVGDLRALLDDSRVRTVRVTDVAFNLS